MTIAAGIDVGTAAVKAVLFRPSETRRSDGGVSVHRKGGAAY
jgi:sugar (pentulose or hexulose) kinase